MEGKLGDATRRPKVPQNLHELLTTDQTTKPYGAKLISLCM